MKKLLNTSFDILLFSLLVIVFLIPFLVSLNLDPKLYQKSSNVAGVTTINDSTKDYIGFAEIYSSNERLFLRNSTYKKNTYTAQFKLSKGEKFEDKFELGTVKNYSSTVKTLNIDLYGEKDDLSDLNLSIQVGDQKYTLFGNHEVKSIEVDIPADFETNISLLINPRSSINFDRGFTLQIKPVVVD